MSDQVFHLPEDIQDLFLKAALGRAMTGILLDRRAKDPLSFIVNRAREAFIDAVPSFLDADLYTKEGLAKARQAQAEVRRYLTMVTWITDATEIGDEAQKEVLRTGDPVFTDGLVELLNDGTEIPDA